MISIWGDKMDQQLFVEYWMQAAPSICKYLGKKVPPASVDDLMQEVAEVAYAKFDQVDQEYISFRKWAFSIAHNKVLQYYDKSYSHERLKEAVLRTSQHFADDISEHSAAMDDIDAIRFAFSKLNADERTLLSCRYFEGMSYSEIAQTTGKSIASLKTAHHRIINKLQSDKKIIEYRNLLLVTLMLFM